MKLSRSSEPASTGPTLISELRGQGGALRDRAEMGRDAAAQAAGLLAREDVHYLLVAARGSSDNAAVHAQYAFGAESRLTVALAAPSLFRNAGRAPDLSGAAVLAISQSGQSPDITGVTAAARAQGRPTIAITNDPASPLAASADVVIPLGVGDEQSVAATKTYMASLQALEQILAALEPTTERSRWLALLPEVVTSITETQLEDEELASVLDDASTLTAVGRGMDLAAARETALKIRELGGLPCEGLSPADLLHGPIASFAPSGCLWVVAAATVDEPWAPITDRARAKSMPIISVSADPRLCAAADVVVSLPGDAAPWVRSIAAVIPGQVAALRLAQQRGVDIDRPHGLSKVTITH